MADGSEHPIKDIQYGDQVRSGNGETARVANVIRGTEQELTRIDLASGRTLLLTPDHPVITQRGVQRADALGATDTLKADYAAVDPPEILCRNTVQDRFDVYGLDLEDNDTFIAERIVVGSIRMQGQLGQDAWRKISMTRRAMLWRNWSACSGNWMDCRKSVFRSERARGGRPPAIGRRKPMRPPKAPKNRSILNPYAIKSYYVVNRWM